MTENLERVLKFMLAGGQQAHYLDENYVPSFEERVLGVRLVFSELAEFADALGINRSFINMMGDKTEKILNEGKDENTLVFNKIEVLDGINDMEVTVLGNYLRMGFGDIAEESFTEVMDSNDSKFCYSEDDALATIAGKEWTSTKKEIDGRNIYAFRDKGGKIQKGINYFKPNLKKILTKEVV